MDNKALSLQLNDKNDPQIRFYTGSNRAENRKLSRLKKTQKMSRRAVIQQRRLNKHQPSFFFKLQIVFLLTKFIITTNSVTFTPLGKQADQTVALRPAGASTSTLANQILADPLNSQNRIFSDSGSFETYSSITAAIVASPTPIQSITAVSGMGSFLKAFYSQHSGTQFSIARVYSSGYVDLFLGTKTGSASDGMVSSFATIQLSSPSRQIISASFYVPTTSQIILSTSLNLIGLIDIDLVATSGQTYSSFQKSWQTGQTLDGGFVAVSSSGSIGSKVYGLTEISKNLVSFDQTTSGSGVVARSSPISTMTDISLDTMNNLIMGYEKGSDPGSSRIDFFEDGGGSFIHITSLTLSDMIMEVQNLPTYQGYSVVTSSSIYLMKITTSPSLAIEYYNIEESLISTTTGINSLISGVYIDAKESLVALDNEFNVYAFRVCSSTSACLTSTSNSFLGCQTSTQFYNSVALACQSCDSSCSRCSGALSTECVACSDGKFLSGGTCSSCSDSTCLTCSGSGSDKCSRCSSTTVLVKPTTSSTEGSCCPVLQGSYMDLTSNTCLICDSGCSVCDSTKCLEEEATSYQQVQDLKPKCFEATSFTENASECFDSGVAWLESNLVAENQLGLEINSILRFKSQDESSTADDPQEVVSELLQAYTGNIKDLFDFEIIGYKEGTTPTIAMEFDTKNSVFMTMIKLTTDNEVASVKDRAEVEIKITPKYFNLLEDLAPTSSRRLNRRVATEAANKESSEEENRQKRMTQRDYALSSQVSTFLTTTKLDTLKELNKAGNLLKRLNLRVSKATSEPIRHTPLLNNYFDQSEIDSYTDLGWIMGIVLHCFVVTLMVLSSVLTFKGINLRALTLFYWVFLQYISSAGLLTNEYNIQRAYLRKTITSRFRISVGILPAKFTKMRDFLVYDENRGVFGIYGFTNISKTLLLVFFICVRRFCQPKRSWWLFKTIQFIRIPLYFIIAIFAYDLFIVSITALRVTDFSASLEKLEYVFTVVFLAVSGWISFAVLLELQATWYEVISVDKGDKTTNYSMQTFARLKLYLMKPLVDKREIVNQSLLVLKKLQGDLNRVLDPSLANDIRRTISPRKAAGMFKKLSSFNSVIYSSTIRKLITYDEVGNLQINTSLAKSYTLSKKFTSAVEEDSLLKETHLSRLRKWKPEDSAYIDSLIMSENMQLDYNRNPPDPPGTKMEEISEERYKKDREKTKGDEEAARKKRSKLSIGSKKRRGRMKVSGAFRNVGSKIPMGPRGHKRSSFSEKARKSKLNKKKKKHGGKPEGGYKQVNQIQSDSQESKEGRKKKRNLTTKLSSHNLLEEEDLNENSVRGELFKLNLGIIRNNTASAVIQPPSYNEPSSSSRRLISKQESASRNNQVTPQRENSSQYQISHKASSSYYQKIIITEAGALRSNKDSLEPEVISQRSHNPFSPVRSQNPCLLMPGSSRRLPKKRKKNLTAAERLRSLKLRNRTFFDQVQKKEKRRRKMNKTKKEEMDKQMIKEETAVLILDEFLHLHFLNIDPLKLTTKEMTATQFMNYPKDMFFHMFLISSLSKLVERSTASFLVVIYFEVALLYQFYVIFFRFKFYRDLIARNIIPAFIVLGLCGHIVSLVSWWVDLGAYEGWVLGFHIFYVVTHFGCCLILLFWVGTQVLLAFNSRRRFGDYGTGSDWYFVNAK